MQLHAEYSTGLVHEVVDHDTGALVASVFVEGFEGLRLARLLAASPDMVSLLANAGALLSDLPASVSVPASRRVRLVCAIDDVLRRLEV